MFGCINFDEDMDNTQKPPASKLRFEVNSEPSNATQIEWSTNRVMSQFRTLSASFGDDVDLVLPTTNLKYRTAIGALVEPYDLDAVDLNLEAGRSYSDPDLEIDIGFTFDMDTNFLPTTDQLEVIVDGIPIVPDNIRWDDPLTLIIELTAAEFLLDTLTIELLEASNNMKTSAGAIICRWKLDVPA